MPRGAATLGLLVLAGWYTHTVDLVRLLPAFVSMQYNTALGFLLCGVGLLSLLFGRLRLALAWGAVAAAVGVVTLAVVLWQALIVQERAQIARLINAEANSLRTEIEEEIEPRILALVHAVNRTFSNGLYSVP